MSIEIAANKLAAAANHTHYTHSTMIYSPQSANMFNFQLKLLHELKFNELKKKKKENMR